MIEMRERLVRIETKMDGAAEKAEAQQATLSEHDKRLTSLETDASQLRSTLGTLRWIGGAGVTAAGLLGIDKLSQLLRLG
jgi:hypothetical protein